MTDVIDKYEQTFRDAGEEWNVDPTLLKALAKHESGGDPAIRGKSGEIGLGQFMPDTARRIGITDRSNPVQSIWGMAKLMNEALVAEHDNPTAALRYYNGGAGWRNSRTDPNYPSYVGGQYKKYAKANTGSMTDATPAAASTEPAKLNDADWLDEQAKTYPHLAGPNAATPAKPASATGGPAVPSTSSADAPSADDLLARMGRLSGGPAASPAAPVKVGSETPAEPAAPSGDDLLRRMGELAPLAPAAVPGGPKADQIGVYSKAGQAAGDIPGLRPTATGPAPPPVASEPGPGERGVAGNLLAAVREGYANTPPVLTPEAREAVQQSGWAGRNLLNPVLDAAGAVLGAGGAAGGAIGQGAYETGKAIGGPELGRDFHGLAQTIPVAMTMLPPGTKLPGAVGRTPEYRAPEPPPHPLAGVAEVSPEAQVRIAGNPKGIAEPSPPAPESVGAAASREGTAPEALTARTKAQTIADLEKSVTQTAEDRAGPQMQDDTRYVKGIPDRTLAAQDFSDSQHALDEKTRIGQSTEFRNKVDDINRKRNQGMVDLLAADAKDGNLLEAAHETRQLVSPDEMGVFEHERPVDAAHNLAAVDRVLQSRAGKRDAISAVLNKVRNSFLDKDGNLETSPSQLYGVRQNITDLLKKGAKGTTDEAEAVRAAKSILTGLLPELDKTITEGAPQFSRYLQAWHELSKPIDRMEFLQQYQTGTKKITGGDGYLQPNKVQKMLDDVLQGHKSRGVHAAKMLTDEEIGNITAVRNELAAQQLKDRLASVRGSDTFQQINRAGAFSGPVGTALGTLARVGGIIGTGGTLNLLYEHGIRPGVARRREAKIATATAARENALLGGIPPQQ